jgi:hypothetical protein
MTSGFEVREPPGTVHELQSAVKVVDAASDMKTLPIRMPCDHRICISDSLKHMTHLMASQGRQDVEFLGS